MRGKRCPRCGELSFSARTIPPWPCPSCGAECFFAPDEPITGEEEKRPERRINAAKAAVDRAASLPAR